MWTLVFRKIINNKWMMLCLLFGFIIVVAMVSAVPMYSNAILQKMLQEDLTSYQVSHATYAGLYEIDGSYKSLNKSGDAKEKAYKDHDQKAEEFAAEYGSLVICSVRRSIAQNMVATPYFKDDPNNETRERKSAIAYSISDIDEHVEIKYGKCFEPTKDGFYEVMVTENAYKNLGLSLGSEYRMSCNTKPEDYICFRVVGVFTIGDRESNYWYVAGGITQYGDALIFREEDFHDILFNVMENDYLYKSEWRYAIDYTKLNMSNIDGVIEKLGTQIGYLGEKNNINASCIMLPTLRDYVQRATALKVTLWVINVPIIVMLALYIFMVAQIVIKNDEDEIAVLRSRGASGKQIFSVYILESLILGVIALILGPPLSFILCKIVGSANGFLEFINRGSLPVRLVSSIYVYAIAAVIFFIITMLIPAVGASRSSIVERKRKRSRFAEVPLWKKFFLDVILLGGSIYGLYNYKNYTSMLKVSGASAVETSIDPLLFLLSSLFILGAGLLFLRLYPYIIRLVFAIGRKKWSPSAYSAFLHVGRSSGQEQFLQLFLILAVAVGIFSANAARTLNRNTEDHISYMTGADVVITPQWKKENAYDLEGMKIDDEYVYVEPDFREYKNIDGVEAAARVFIDETAKVQSQKSMKGVNNVKAMAIDAVEFNSVAWTRNDLFYPYTISSYLKLLYDAPRGAIISRGLANELKISEGDIVNVSISGDDTKAPVIVYAVVDFWPSIQPYNFNFTYRDYSSGSGNRRGGNRTSSANTGNTGADSNDLAREKFIIFNIEYMQVKFAVQPYRVWLKKAPGATDTEIFNYIQEHQSELLASKIKYVDQQLRDHKNDPQIQGFNGMLTLGFIITMCICIIGFLIYWVISIRSRTMQFGVLRAMGMTFKSIINMMLVEQGLISLVPIIVGFFLGGLSSELFVPMLEMVYSVEDTVPGFMVIMQRSDYVKIYVIVAVMLVIGISVLARLISKTRMDQALKLGED